jgi:hypothetical protein
MQVTNGNIALPTTGRRLIKVAALKSTKSPFRAWQEDVSFARILDTSRTSGQFRTKEVVIEC